MENVQDSGMARDKMEILHIGLDTVFQRRNVHMLIAYFKPWAIESTAVVIWLEGIQFSYLVEDKQFWFWSGWVQMG